MKNFNLYLTLPIFALILAKVFLFNECFSFDSHDDANHAFPNLSLSIEILKNFSLPLFNFYNNFGVPLLGDALTYPLSIQSITYYFLPDYMAMTLNRLIIAALTFYAANKFFEINNLNYSRPLLSLLIIFIPVSFWYPVHHYQMNMFFFLINFYLLDNYFKKTNHINFLYLIFSSIFYVLSVSINLVLLSLPFYFFWVLFKYKKSTQKLTFSILFLLSIVCITFSQHYEFFHNYFNSARLGESVYYTILTNVRELFLGILITPGDWIAYNYGAQLQVISYISFPILIFSIYGFFIDRFSNKYLLINGAVFTLLSFGLYAKSSLWLNLPLFKNIDILRILWFSLPFVLVYVGKFYENTKSLLKIHSFFGIFFSISVLLLFINLEELANLSFIYYLQVLSCLIIFTILSLRKNNNYEQLLLILISIALIVAIVPTFYRTLGFNNSSCHATQYSTTKDSSQFIPSTFIDLIDKNTRVATEVHTHKGHDTRLTKERIFGSNARGIVVDNSFGKILESNNLVFVDQVPYGYYFSRPWNTEILSLYGIRYIVTSSISIELDKQGWKNLSIKDGYYLYKNPQNPSIIYVKNKDGNITYLDPLDYYVKDNSLNINYYSKDNLEMLIAINYRNDFKFYKNNKETKALKNQYGLIKINLEKGDNHIKIEYTSLNYKFYILLILLGILILFLIHRNNKI